jgi:hypothetical protein
MSKSRTARQVIDQAIRENRFSERLLYSLAASFAIIGVGILVFGAVKGQQLTVLAGSISAGLFWPAARLARQIRRENIAIRLLEAPLGMAETAQQAAETIQRLVENILRDNPQLAPDSARTEKLPEARKRSASVSGDGDA